MDVLVAFKAGLAHLIDGTVTPDPRRGELRVVVETDEGLVHFQWLERGAAGASGPPEVDIVVMPEEADFVKDVQPGARVMQLRFKDSSRQSLFFWMQEPDSSADADLCRAVHGALNMGEESEEPSRSADLTPGFGGEDVSSQPPGGGVQASDLARILTAIGVPQQGQAAAAAPAAPAAAAAGPSVAPGLTADFLASVLAGVQQQQQQAGGEGGRRLPSLAQVLTPQNVVPLLQRPGTRARLGELLEHLPPELQAEAAADPAAAAVETWRSAPLQNQLRLLSHALASGQLDFSQFGMEPLGFTAADFLASVDKKAAKERSEKEGKQ